jgi:hypothetical protein
MGSPRYLAEHILMPRFLHERGLAVVDAIERNDADFFIPVWFEAGFRFSPVLIFQVHASYRVGVVTFPMPREDTEAYLGVFVVPPTAGTIRYFTWERSLDIMTGQPATVIGEWSDRGHGNHGEGPPFTGDLSHDTQALILRVLAVAAR